MTFLSGESIIARLKNDLIIDIEGRPSGNVEQVECNSYELKIGCEAFVTIGTKTTKGKLLKRKNGEIIEIESGQFGILITEEIISIPNDLFGMISLKSTVKFHGLVNISGFHVDPGWKGRLIFTVFNAGPGSISLKVGDRAFLIWFAKLDKSTEKVYKTYESKSIRTSITTEDINKIKGDTYTPQVLSKRIDQLELTRRWSIPVVLGTILLGIIVGYASFILQKQLHRDANIQDDALIELKGAIDNSADKIQEIKAEIEQIKKKTNKSK